MSPPSTVGANSAQILTIALEDYFQVGAFNRFVQKNQWYRFETRLEQTTETTLALLDRHRAKATFFVLGWVAKRFPALVRRIAEAGHEVAIKGYYHRSIRGMTPEEFEADCIRARDVVEQASGRPVIGYRLADGWFAPEDLWALDALAGLGFLYDSSIAPMGSDFTGQPFRSHIHQHEANGRTLIEVPISTAKILGVRIPVAGGNYLRQLPSFLTRRAAAAWVEREPSPLVAYFHAWELDPDQPRLAVGSWLTRKRHYRNLDKMEHRLADLLTRHRFTSVADYLNIDTYTLFVPLAPVPEADGEVTVFPVQRNADTPFPRRYEQPTIPISIVVPLFNENESIRFLWNTLDHVRKQLADKYDVTFLLIDDGSTDDTWNLLQQQFEDQPGIQLHQHSENLGVAAAIMTGLRKAQTEIVASMDCDCSYDPLELRHMIPLLQPGISVVTASPYHPEGRVRNVPKWRLTLSKGATWLYRRILHQKLFTYTSCFRVYRRSLVAGLQLSYGRYLGVAEMLGRIDLTGGTILEHPATLEVRVLGRSKMKTMRTIVGHLALMAKLARARISGKWMRAQRDQVIKEVIVSHTANKAVLIRNHPKLSPAVADDVRRFVVNPGSRPPNSQLP